MKSTLFPHYYRYIGWPLLGLGLLFGFFFVFYEYEIPWLDWKMIGLGDEIFKFQNSDDSSEIFINDNFTNELVALLVLIGSVLIAFSKERVEDEFFQQLRFDAIIWALKIQALILLLAILFLFNFVFLQFMMIALVSFFILYIGRYHYLMYRLRKRTYEE
jgi:hypothetical protein